MGQGSAEFSLVEGFFGRGVYVGKRKLADERQLALYHEQLKAAYMTIPSGTVYVTVMTPFRMGDLINEGSTLAKELFLAMQSHLEADYHKRKPVPSANICYVGKDFAGRLDKVRPLLNGFDRAIIREGIADTLLDNLPVNARHVFNRHELQQLRDIRS